MIGHPRATRTTNCVTVAGLLAGTALLSATPALSQGVAVATSAPASANFDPNEIVVTATHRSEAIQNVPVSIQALSAVKLEQHQVTSVDDYVKLLPSVSYQSYGPGQSQLFFRGVTSGGDGGYGIRGGSLPTSGLYIDDIPVTTIGNAVDFHVYDISRVEALSGPQGTLFGASSLAGTLRLITNQPDTSKFSAGYDVQGNKFGKGDAGGMAEGFANIPINEAMAVRVVGFYEHDGGYIDNVPSTRTYTLGDNDPTNDITINNAKFVKKNFNDVTTYGGRAALKVDLNNNWTATPAIIYQHQVAHGAFLYDPADGDLKVNDYTSDLNRDHWYQASLTIQGKLSDWDVVYAGGYMGRTIHNEADYSYYSVAYDAFPGYTKFADGKGGFLDPTQVFVGSDYISKQTHELRVSSPADKPLRILAGMFYQRQSDHAHASFGVPGVASIPDSPAVPECGDAIFCTNDKITDRDYAMFTEVSYDILHNLTLTGGVRGFMYKNSSYGFSGYQSAAEAATCIPTTNMAYPCINTNRTTQGSGETHKINLSWKIDRDHMVYATWSTGFRPGGANRNVAIKPYAPDTLTNYEVGWKTSWFDHHLTVNGAAFVEKWNKLQYGLPGTGGVVSIYNAGNANIKGIEGDFAWRVGRNLTLSGSGTYIDAKLTTDFCAFDATQNPNCANGIAAPKGTRLPVQPRFKGNATARYQFDMPDWKPFLQAAVLHQGGTRSWLTDNEAELLGPTKGFTTFDFSTGIAHSNWTAELFIQNAFDKRGELSINTVCVPSICGFRPRIYSVKPQFFGIKFGQKF